MTINIMQQEFLFKRYDNGELLDYTPKVDEPVLDYRGPIPRLRIGDNATAGGVPIYSGGVGGVFAPTITSPVQSSTGITLSPIITSSAFSGISVSGETLSHLSTVWQVSTDPTFATTVFDSGEDTSNLTSIDLSLESVVLTPATAMYVRAKYIDGAGGVSGWSGVVSFTTAELSSVDTPSITTPSTGQTNFSRSGAFTGSDFVGQLSNGDPDTIATSEWEFRIGSETGDVASTQQSNTTTLNTTTLYASTTYYVRVRYQGTGGLWSEWSNFINITTTAPPNYSQPPPAPTLTFAAPGEVPNATSVWMDSTLAAGVTSGGAADTVDYVTYYIHTGGQQYSIAETGSVYRISMSNFKTVYDIDLTATYTAWCTVTNNSGLTGPVSNTVVIDLSQY